MPTTRLRRAEQVERNREEVLAGARRVFLARGYGKATVEAIAEDAGFSTGVVYSQFGSKADLFLALLERRIDERAERNDEVTAPLAGREGVQALVRTARRDSAAEKDWLLLLLEFRLVAARDPELNARYAALHNRTVERLASTLEGLHERAGIPPAVPVTTMARFVLAFGVGVTLERTTDADVLIDDELLPMMTNAFGLAS
jgi:AcrR family transcriptional regulator